MTLEQRPIIVTGAAGGLGGAVVEDLLNAGARLCLMDRDHAALQRCVTALNTGGAQAPVAIPCDLADEASAADAFAQTEQAFGGPPSALVHLAGRIVNRPLVNLLDRDSPRHPFSVWRDTLAANLDSAFLAGALAAEQMVKARVQGTLVLISSVAAQGNAGQTAYAAAKAGVESLVKVWARELGAFGIRTVAIAPGFFDTPATHTALGEKGVEAKLRATPLRRLGQPEALAATVRHALENDFLSGTTIHVDGGLSI